MPYQDPTGKLHVLFLNGQDGLGADIAVHISIARALDRNRIRVSAATTIQTTSGGDASARAGFEEIPELTFLPLDIGRTIGRQRGVARLIAMLDNLRGGASLIALAVVPQEWCGRRPRDRATTTGAIRTSPCPCGGLRLSHPRSHLPPVAR